MIRGILHARGLSAGELSQVPLVEVLGYAYARKETGRLSLTRGRQRKEIFFLQGMPVFVTSSAPAENLFEVLLKFNKLTPEELLQLRALQKEKGFSAEETLRQLGLFTDAEIYCFQLETFFQMVINACGWRDGGYEFQRGEQFLAQVPMFDLSPLELIYRGVKNHHLFNLAQEIQALQEKKIRLAHGWEQTLSLPQIFYERSDLLDLFEQEISVADAVPRLQQELGDLNEALLLMFILLVTGLLVFSEPEAARPLEPRAEPPSSPAKEPAAAVDTVYISTQRRPERVKTGERPSSVFEDQKRQAAQTQNLQRQMAEAQRRLEEVEKQFSEAGDAFQALGVEIDSSPREVQKTYALLKQRLRLEQTPAEVQEKLKPQAVRLEARLEEFLQLVLQPEKRVAYEQELFQAEKKKAWNIPLRQKLAQRQWRRGKWFLENGASDFAPRYFEQAVELDPEQPLYYAYVGWAIYRSRQRNLTEARAYLNQALNLNPRLDQAHYFLGIIAKREGDHGLAEHHFRKAYESNPQHVQAKRELDLLAAQQSQPQGLLSRLLGKPIKK